MMPSSDVSLAPGAAAVAGAARFPDDAELALAAGIQYRPVSRGGIGGKPFGISSYACTDGAGGEVAER